MKCYGHMQFDTGPRETDNAAITEHRNTMQHIGPKRQISTSSLCKSEDFLVVYFAEDMSTTIHISRKNHFSVRMPLVSTWKYWVSMKSLYNLKNVLPRSLMRCLDQICFM